MTKLKFLINRVKCYFGVHTYTKFFKDSPDSTVLYCSHCKEFRFGRAIDNNGEEIFLFTDGSCLMPHPKLGVDE